MQRTIDRSFHKKFLNLETNQPDITKYGNSFPPGIFSEISGPGQPDKPNSFPRDILSEKGQPRSKMKTYLYRITICFVLTYCAIGNIIHEFI